MTLKVFTQLSEVEQMRVIIVYGVLVAERTSGNNQVYLYAVGSFYIELFHELDATKDTALRILRTFEDVEFLDEYLIHIEIPVFS